MALDLVASAALTILSGQTASSDSIRTGHWTSFGLVIPAGMNGSNIHFLVSTDDSTYQLLVDSSNSTVALTIGAAATSVAIPTSVSLWPYFKIESGTSQSGNRSFVVLAKQ
jgi:hypothetical protein